jgi:hypothetical protein
MKVFLVPLSCFLVLAAVCNGAEGDTEVVVGKTAPDITVTGIDGKTLTLSQVTERGKNVALMFSRAHW